MATVTAPPPRPTRRRPRPVKTPLHRRARRVVTVACVACLAVAALSWVPAVTGSRNLSLTVASVEWLRSHGGNPIASQIENWYYELNEPGKGGPALTSLPGPRQTPLPQSIPQSCYASLSPVGVVVFDRVYFFRSGRKPLGR